MLERSESAELKAIQLFKGGFNCSESTLMAIADACGFDLANIPSVATGFGGGIGRLGGPCGAVTGGAMAIGIAVGRKSLAEDHKKETATRLVCDFAREFEQTVGHMACKEISGCLLSDPVQRARFQEEGIKEKKCFFAVTQGVKLALGVIETSRERNSNDVESR